MSREARSEKFFMIVQIYIEEYTELKQYILTTF